MRIIALEIRFNAIWDIFTYEVLQLSRSISCTGKM